MNPEELARLEAEAEAEAEFQFQQQQQQLSQRAAPTYQAPEPESTSGLWPSFVGAAKGVAKGIPSVVTAPADLITRGAVAGIESLTGTEYENPEQFYPSNVWGSVIDSATQGAPSNATAEKVGNIAGSLAGVTRAPSALGSAVRGTPAIAKGSSGLIEKALVGTGVGTVEGAAYGAAYGAKDPNADLGEQATTGAAYGGITGVALPAIGAVADDVGKGLSKAWSWISGAKPREELLQAQSVNKDIFANKLDIASSPTDKERHLIREASQNEDAFARMNPFEGIDPNGGRKAFEAAQQKLTQSEIAATRARNEILPKVARIESGARAKAAAEGVEIRTGISLDEIPRTIETPKGLYGLDDIREAYPGGVSGVDDAERFVQKEFGVIDDAGNLINPKGRPLSIEEADRARKRIDASIRGFGGYDDSYWLSKQVDPSVGDAYISTLQFYRKQLDQAVKGRMTELAGPEAAKAFTEAGENISAAKTYAPLMDRFKLSTGQAYTPGSAKKVPPGVGVLGTGGKVDAITQAISPNLANRRMQTSALQREGNAIRDLQALVDMKAGTYQTPVNRNWDQIKNTAQDLSLVGILATQMGLIQAPEQLATMPDIAARQVAAEVAKSVPQAFAPTQDGVSVMDNKYLDPIEKDAIVSQALEADPATRARVVGSSFENKYQPLNKAPAPVATAPRPQVPSIESLNSMIPTTPMSDAMSNIEQLEAMTAIHARDIQ